MNTTYNKSVFSDLLKRAIGDRQQKAFAASIGISPAHLSRMVRQHFDTPPNIQTLKKIASEASNGVTFQDLLSACGYTIADTNSHGSPLGNHSADRFLRAAVLSAIESLQIPWRSESDQIDSFLDLQITFPSAHWYFKFLHGTEDTFIRQQQKEYYFNLLFRTIPPEDQFSFVTCSDRIFQLYQEQLPSNLKINLSILLVDQMQLTIQQEALLATFYGDLSSKETLFSFCP